MKRIIGSLILKLGGWKVKVDDEHYKIKKYVAVCAPHTSNWDFVFAMSFFFRERIKVRFFIKDSYIKGAFGWFFKSLGAIGVDRSKNNNLVDFAVSEFEKRDSLVLLVPAEGTRRRVEKWKTGFYHIATKADVPIAMGYLDFEKKEGGVKKFYRLSGDFEKDMQEIEDFYRNIKGKNPENYNPKIF
ncbi:1-acyl-sn-glycerol-3-phosphate acyltransferase [Aureivirga sp. CE67]|uniref:1-acyl-sn-glycerol-3-phosphate acyltransferase n=1 Tax=Aureivirga sp. CE67 TaxID=1788983 RepID=UPI0018CBA7F2|nr:1-acyl-sn-glycerol-3-phosphate acyltransferase [Aureivirga sp. CE67]